MYNMPISYMYVCVIYNVYVWFACLGICVLHVYLVFTEVRRGH